MQPQDLPAVPALEQGVGSTEILLAARENVHGLVSECKNQTCVTWPGSRLTSERRDRWLSTVPCSWQMHSFWRGGPGGAWLVQRGAQ